MGRFAVISLAIAATLLLTFGLTAADNGIKAMDLEKECILFGRIANRNVLLYPTMETVGGYDFLPVPAMPRMAELKGFEVLNTRTGDWIPLDISDDGYFCANVDMGRYDLRGRDRFNQPYVIHSFAIPRGMAVNLGTFWVETHDPALISREGWASHLRGTGWAAYEEGAFAVAVNFEHIVDDGTYAQCEEWFQGCHEEVYLAFEPVMVRR